MNWTSFYFPWLQKGNPTGEVERFPEITGGFETSVHGIYCIGDLTGVPLINLAATSGRRVIDTLMGDAAFGRQRSEKRDPEIYDVVIVGAGPAGITAAIEAQEVGLRVVVLEAGRAFNTLRNFPAKKPIHIIDVPDSAGPLTFNSDNKEDLIEELLGRISAMNLPIEENTSVRAIEKKSGFFTVEAKGHSYRALRVVVAIGKSGNSRRLHVAGESLPKVFSRLIDPSAFKKKASLVVGGGDSALEAAMGLAKSGSQVTLSYRGDGFSRPKEANLAALHALESTKKIRVVLNSTVSSISASSVTLITLSGEETIENDVVFSLIGTDIPLAFFDRANIRIENTRGPYDYLVLVALLLFSCLLYFGKSAAATPAESVSAFFSIPGTLLDMPFDKWIKALVAWVSFIGLIGVAVVLVVKQVRDRKMFAGPWEGFKWVYFASTALLFLYLYIHGNLLGNKLLGFTTGSWYTTMYSLTILVFGLRRMHVHPTSYIKKQTWTLIAIQVFPLFLLPVFILPWLGGAGLIPEWIMNHVFPGGSYWRAYGLILAWPLFLYNLASGQPYLFWLVFSIVQTFIVIPYIVYRFGKGAYCGWICSCGGLAETLGDEYRTLAPHGPTAKKWENAGQVVLWFAAIVTLFALFRTWAGISVPHAGAVARTYSIVVDIIFAGVLGVGVYFTFSGRIWCRFLCPLAALMHIYARFSLYRIFSKKTRCISCGICTKVCHMGIDVMGFANRGIPMNDVECVRCSACIVNCPMDVLSFGSQSKIDLDNDHYLQEKVG